MIARSPSASATRWARSACRSPSSSPPFGRSSAPDLQGAAQAALALLFFTTGARTPLLALLALRRPRILAAVVLPYVALGIVAVLVKDPAVVLLALSPAPLIGPRLARAIGAREETVGALTTATIVLSLPILMAAATGLATAVNMALFAFVFGAAIAGMMPTLRDTMLPVFDGARYLAVAILIAAAAVAGGPLLDVRAFVLAVAILVVGTLSAAIGAAAFRGDPFAAAIGGGSRDPAVAAALAIGSGLAGAGSVPLAYAVLLALAMALGKLVVRRQP